MLLGTWTFYSASLDVGLCPCFYNLMPQFWHHISVQCENKGTFIDVCPFYQEGKDICWILLYSVFFRIYSISPFTNPSSSLLLSNYHEPGILINTLYALSHIFPFYYFSNYVLNAYYVKVVEFSLTAREHSHSLTQEIYISEDSHSER